MTREKLLGRLAVFLLKALFLTIRVRLKDDGGFLSGQCKGPIIMCFWHNRILGITLAHQRKYLFKERKGVVVLTSASKDGGILAAVAGGFRMGAIRGSSSRRGTTALLELVREIEQGKDIAITPDGPRGPRYKLGPGAVLLAQKTGAPLVPMHAIFSRFIQMKTWDGFIIPLPFSTISATLGTPIPVPPVLTDEEFENMRQRVETILRNETN